MRSSSQASSPQSWRTIIRRPIFLVANIALLVAIAASTVRETYRGWSVDREIEALEAQASSLEGRRLQLEELTKTLVSAERVDYDARARLGRKKPGERVIILEGMATTSWRGAETDDATWQHAEPAASSDPTLPASNPARWANYFFHR